VEFYTSSLKSELRFRFGIFKMIRERPINIIPETETASGDSSGRIIQLKTAPDTGIRNFQILSSDTFIFGRRSKVFQMVIAAADKKLS